MMATGQSLNGSIERYKKVEDIESYGFCGRTYKARDLLKFRFVFVKRVRLGSEQRKIPTYADREIRVHQRLKHPNIVRFYEAILFDEHINLVFDFLDQTLQDLLDQHRTSGGIPSDSIISYTYQMFRGIEFCHSQGILHRDLKPRNMMIDHDGTLKIGSFSLARFEGQKNALTREVVTLRYRCPEILLGADQYSTAIDIWSIGCIIAELASRKPLFQEADAEVVQLFLIFRLLGTPTEETWPGVTKLRDYNPMFPDWPPKHLGSLFPRLDAHGLDLLAQTLAYDPERRISAAAALDMPFLHEVDER
jgi:serine/threonine protein kinase